MRDESQLTPEDIKERIDRLCHDNPHLPRREVEAMVLAQDAALKVCGVIIRRRRKCLDL